MTVDNLYNEVFGQYPSKKTLIAASGSNRRYYRMAGIKDLIGCEGTDIEENKAFIYLSRHFFEKGLPVPKIEAVAPDYSCYLIEDLGDVSLFDAIKEGSTTGVYSAYEEALMTKTIQLLPTIQFKGAEGLDFDKCYPCKSMDGRMVDWDLNYFKYCFLKQTGIEFNESLLQDDFDALKKILVQDNVNTFMYRDFQSRNIMLKSGDTPYLIDYQGGRMGSVEYDVASFLWQAKANIPEDLRHRLIEAYISSAKKYPDFDEAGFRNRLMHFVLFRTLQVLGAYGFRGLIEKKAHFIQSIPLALGNLKKLLSDGILDSFNELKRISELLVHSTRFRTVAPHHNLVVKVMSFSYKRGIPEDLSGNGGGYVFDCRAIHNPGRYDEYKPLTGRDRAVIDFLDNQPTMAEFLNHVYALTSESVEVYLRRGFTDLMISFGCTGGQHRSVYSAEHVAKYLNDKYGVEVRLEHREQQISETLPSKEIKSPSHKKC